MQVKLCRLLNPKYKILIYNPDLSYNFSSSIRVDFLENIFICYIFNINNQLTLDSIYMEIKSKSFSPQHLASNSVINFPNGIPGFDDQTQFQLFQLDDNELIYSLQSLNNESIAFSVALPSDFNINYNFVLTDEEEATLEINSINDLLILLILHKNERGEASTLPIIKGSIKSPLLINTKRRIGLQKLLGAVEQSITLTEKHNEIELSEA